MKKTMHLLFLSCLKAAGLIEKKLDFKLPIKERLQLKMQKLMCEACTEYEKHTIRIELEIFNKEKPNVPNIDLEALLLMISKN